MKNYLKGFTLIFTVSILLFMSCGEDGSPGPQGEQGLQGEQGPPGEDGQDGQDGQDGEDGNTTAFYFQQGFKGYEGVKDTYVGTDILGDFSSQLQLSVYFDPEDINPDFKSNALVRFDGLDVVGNEFNDEDWVVNEAVLYLHATYSSDLVNQLLLGVAPLDSMAPLFIEEEVTYEAANAEENWPSSRPGPVLDGYNSSLYSLPTAIGEVNSTVLIIPLPRSIVERWIKNSDTNKGLLFGLYDLEGGKGQVSIQSSQSEPEDFRPMLYINAERMDENASGRQVRLTEEEYFKAWSNKSYQEKMIPYYNKK